jgi:hypothetical protein
LEVQGENSKAVYLVFNAYMIIELYVISEFEEVQAHREGQ